MPARVEAARAGARVSTAERQADEDPELTDAGEAAASSAQRLREYVAAELRAPLITLLIVVPVLALAGWSVHGTVRAAAEFQRDIRIAQLTRTRVLRDQLDEETGIRGFLFTGDGLFLEPYRNAQADLPAAYGRLKTRLAQLRFDRAARLVDDERRLNDAWTQTIAAPALAAANGTASARKLQYRGKALVDDFRNDDQRLQAFLDSAATAADAQSEAAVSKTLVFNIVALIAITFAAAIFGVRQARAARRSFRNRVLFENQKRIADSLQTAFLQKELPLSPSLGLHATYVPATAEAQVGGDWYDAFELPDGRILFSIGDVAGHGLDAAVVMSRARQSIVAAALHENDPARVLERANAAILLRDARMVTAICGYIDPKTLEVVYATAGHPAPILARPGKPSEFLPADGIPLGIFADAAYRTFVAHAFDGAVMVLYTDGVIEHKRDVINGQARLLEATRLAAIEKNPALAIQRFVFDVGSPTDDVAILTVTFRASTRDGKNITSLNSLQFNTLDTIASAQTAPATPQELPPPRSVEAPPSLQLSGPTESAARPASARNA